MATANFTTKPPMLVHVLMTSLTIYVVLTKHALEHHPVGGNGKVACRKVTLEVLDTVPARRKGALRAGSTPKHIDIFRHNDSQQSYMLECSPNAVSVCSEASELSAVVLGMRMS